MIRQCVHDFNKFRLNLVNALYEGHLYKENWSPEFRAMRADDIFKHLEEQAVTMLPPLTDLNSEELIALGFHGFVNQAAFNVPIYMHKKAITDGIMTEKTDTDNRGGFFWETITPRRP